MSLAPTQKVAQSRLRACYNCRMLGDMKSFDIRCTNCMSTKGCTANFSGMVTVLNTKSWVMRYQGYSKPGMYALAVAKPPVIVRNHDEEQDIEYVDDDDDDADFEAKQAKKRKDKLERKQKSTKMEDNHEDNDSHGIINRFDNDDDDDDDGAVQIAIGSNRAQE